jgi:predicted small secreted protein
MTLIRSIALIAFVIAVPLLLAACGGGGGGY